MALRITLAVIVGGLLGLERERKSSPAGFRTYILVAIGSTMTVMLSQYLDYMLNHQWLATASRIGIKTDVSRFGAQVINGVGFLGAGTIIVTKRQRVKGLTTAAGLWTAAIIGLVCGAGFAECAIFATLMILFAEIVLVKFEFKFAKSGRACALYIEYTKPDTIQAVLETLSAMSLKVTNLEVSRTDGEDEQHRYYALLSVQTTPKLGGTRIVTEITRLPNVFSVEEL